MRKRFNSAQYTREVQQYLYTITHRFIGMPSGLNYWNYPDIFYWGENEQGSNLIPDLVAIYFNETYAYPYEKRRALESQLSRHIPPRWDCYWFFGEGFIWAERKDIGEPSILPQWIQNKNRHIAHLYDLELKELVETNGYNKEMLEDENVVFMVP
jgi:hypothetical protein